MATVIRRIRSWKSGDRRHPRERSSTVVLACSLPLHTNHRENQGERCSACSGCSLAAQMHAAAVSRQNTRCNPKPQTGPRRSFRCKKWIVNLPSRFRTHAETGIRNRDTHPRFAPSPVCRWSHPHSQSSTRRHCVQRVPNQVRKHLPDLAGKAD